MKYKKHFLFIVALLLMLCIPCVPCFASTEDCDFTIDRTITNATTQFKVAYEGLGRTANLNDGSGNLDQDKQLKLDLTDARLFVTVNGKVAFRKACRDYADIISVKIKKPNAGDIVRISIKAPHWKTKAETILVKKITSIVPSKRSSRVSTPKVEFKRNAKGIYTYHVSAKKGQTVIIRNANEIIKKIRLKKNDTIEGTFIGGALFTSELYIYAVENGFRSKSYTVLPRRMALSDIFWL